METAKPCRPSSVVVKPVIRDPYRSPFSIPASENPGGEY